MDTEQRLGCIIVGREVVVLERPGGRDAAGVDDLVEIALTQPEQRRSIHLGISADEIMELRAESAPLGVDPCLGGLVSAVDEDGLRAPVRFLARQIVAAFEDQDALSGRGKRLSKRSAAGSAADDDHIIALGQSTLRPRYRTPCSTRIERPRRAVVSASRFFCDHVGTVLRAIR